MAWDELVIGIVRTLILHKAEALAYLRKTNVH